MVNRPGNGNNCQKRKSKMYAQQTENYLCKSKVEAKRLDVRYCVSGGISRLNGNQLIYMVMKYSSGQSEQK